MKDNDSILTSENINTSEAESENLIKEPSDNFEENGRNDENPEWDGSEAEYVSDDDAEEYEIPETGIKLSYVLKPEEMYKCLYHSDIYKTKGARAIVQSVIFAFGALAFFLVYFMTNSQYNSYNLFFGILCIVMIAVIWIVPHLHIKSMAKIMADGKTIEAEIYPTHIDIGQGEGSWRIELDGKPEIKEFDNIFMICTPENRRFAIPCRVIEPEVYNEIKAILFSGTKPIEE